MEIREAKKEDAKGLLLHVKAVLKSSTYTLTTFEEFHHTEDSEAEWIVEMKQKKNLILVVVKDGEIIGDLFFVRGIKKRNQHTCEFTLGIQEAFRGQGIGRKLIVALLSWARNTNEIEKIGLQVISGNEAAIGLYNKLGFQEEGRLKKQIKYRKGEYKDLIQMALFLG